MPYLFLFSPIKCKLESHLSSFVTKFKFIYEGDHYTFRKYIKLFETVQYKTIAVDFQKIKGIKKIKLIPLIKLMN